MPCRFVPACCKNLHIIQAVTEVISLGLATTVLPAARAGAIFQVSRYRGKFQGLIRPAAGGDETACVPRAHSWKLITMFRGTGAHWPGWLSPTDSDGAADGVVQAAHVVHLAALRGVMEGRGGEEAEVVG